MPEMANDYIGSFISVLGRQHSSQRLSSPLRRLQFWGLDDSAVRISEEFHGEGKLVSF